MSIFEGSGVAIVTPFKEDKSIDFDKFEDLIEFQIKNKTQALIVGGTTGEAATMTEDEHIKLIEFAVKVANKRVPVIAGSGSNNTQHAIDLSVRAEKVGADALLVVTPYYNKTSDRGLVAHYKEIANSVHIPIIVYNVPGRTGLNIKPFILKKIAENKNIVAIKEASGNVSQAIEIKRLCPDLDIYSGNDDIIVPLMSIGAKGVISVLANVLPKETQEMTRACLDKDYEKAGEMQVAYKRLIDNLFKETNPIPVKACMEIMGLAKGHMRLPLVEALDSTKDDLKASLSELGVLR